MAGVDDSIVEMKFDNAMFERKLTETVKSLDKLRASLDFANGKKSLNDLSSASKNFTMAPMGNSIEDVSRKFLALTTVALSVLSQITQAAFTSGLSIVKSLSLDPILGGFGEFETNMNSIQTILANTKSDGSKLEDVNKALDEMNHYSDQTIYNFSEMAKNVGTFTAAGVNLKDSTDAIKGIANLAAISGSSSEQASTAMYQLSQALAAGKVSLMDWNSVVNAGMGGEVFKKALFETGKAMGTITDVPLGASFEEWEKKGGTFREQMQKGWITADVLKTSLGAFSGELDAAALSSLGFSDKAAQEMVDLGKMGVAAATEVKTFTQLMGTIKEAVGSGWSMTFRTVIGDFAESKALFTGMNNAIGGFIGRSADARNKLLAEWKYMGGRQKLLEGLGSAFGVLAKLFESIRQAFRLVFPKTTSLQLVTMTENFAKFADKLDDITRRAMPAITRAFRGFFSIISIGWEIIKNVGRLVKAIFDEIVDALGGPGAGLISKVASSLIDLQRTLVVGGGIDAFFDKLIEGIKKPSEFIGKLVEGVKDLMGTLQGGSETSALDNVNSRFEHIRSLIETVGDAWDWLVEKTEGVRQALGDLWNYIMQFFRELGDSMKSEMNQGDFEGALDIFNVAFLGGIALMLRNFFKNGFKNLGGGIIDKINGILSQTTGVLKAMQTELKAKALMEIAIAMGILTLALVALSMIDSADLTKALVAMSVGFAQMVGAMAAIQKVTSMTGAFKFSVVAAGMILMAAAMVIFAAAIKILSTLSWQELAKGLIGVGGGMAIMITGINLMTADTSGLIRAGIAMGFIAIALRILANAMQAFATMGWEEMAKGLVGVGAGLAGFVTAMNMVDAEDMIQAGLGIIGIAIGMRILANAMQAFATMSWEDMAKGLVAVGVALGMIVLLTNTMPMGGMIGIGVGLIAVAVALRIIAEVVEEMGKLSIKQLIKGLGGLAVVLTLVAIATNLMNGALAGAAAMIIVAGALLIMMKVVETFAHLSIKELAIGLVGLAAVFAVLGAAAFLLAPVIPEMIALGIAIALLGVGFALFGAGAYLTIKAFELLGKTGKKSMLALIDIIAIFMARAPLIGIAIARVIVSAVTDLAEAAPALIKALKVVLLELLEAVVELAPQIGKAITALVDMMIKVFLDNSPKLIKAGWKFFMDFLKGIRDNISELIDVGSEIIVRFLKGLAKHDQDIVDAAVNLLTSFLSAIGNRAGDVVTAGLKLLTDLMAGVVRNISQVITTATTVMINFVAGLVQNAFRIVDAGVNLLVSFLFGLTRDIFKVMDAVTTIIQAFIFKLGQSAQKIVDAGTNVLVKFLSGVTKNVIKVANAVGEMVSQIITALGDNASKIVTAGTDALLKFLEGLKNNSKKVMDKFRETGLAIMRSIANNIIMGVSEAADILVDFLNQLAAIIRSNSPRITNAITNVGSAIGGAIIDGLTGGLWRNKGKVIDKLMEIVGTAWDSVLGFFGVKSPSRKFIWLGQHLMNGLAIGMDKNGKLPVSSAVEVANNVVDLFQRSLDKANAALPVLDDLNPVITPVLDLSKVDAAARGLDKMMAVSKITPEVSIDRASRLAVAQSVQNGSDETPDPVVQEGNTYIQNNHSPEALSTADIYRQTRSLIVLTKEELNVA